MISRGVFILLFTISFQAATSTEVLASSPGKINSCISKLRSVYQAIAERAPFMGSDKFREAWREEVQSSHWLRKSLFWVRVISLNLKAKRMCKADENCRVETLRKMLAQEVRQSQRMLGAVTTPLFFVLATGGTIMTVNPEALKNPSSWIAGILAMTALGFYRLSIGRHAKEVTEARAFQSAFAAYAHRDPRRVLPGTRMPLVELGHGAMTEMERSQDFPIMRVSDSILKPMAEATLTHLKAKDEERAVLALADGFLRLLAVHPEFLLLLSISREEQSAPDRITAALMYRFWVDLLYPLQKELGGDPKQANEQMRKLIEPVLQLILSTFESTYSTEPVKTGLGSWDQPIIEYDPEEFKTVLQEVVQRLFLYPGPTLKTEGGSGLE